jgi:hypothetical protein
MNVGKKECARGVQQMRHGPTIDTPHGPSIDEPVTERVAGPYLTLDVDRPHVDRIHVGVYISGFRV